MASYLDRIGAGLIIAHPEMLDFDYVPDELVKREAIQTELASKFTTVGSPEGAARAVITGPVGSGKTVLAKTFCRDLQRHLAGKREIKIAHVNCRNASTSMRVAQRILHQFDPGHPDRGLSLGELLLSLRKMLRRTSTHLIVVLDEVDHMLRRSGDELLYQLLRIDEDQDGTGTLSLILISQEQVLDVLETAVLSKFGQSNHLRIPAYSVDELEAIARQRAEIALVPGTWDDGILRLLAERAGTSGDARRVIEYLSSAAERAEFRQDGHTEQTITVDDLHAVNDALATNTTHHLEVVDDLPAQGMLVLLAMCRRLRNEQSMTMGDVERLYAVVCEEYEEKPKSHTTLWKYVKQIEREEIIATRVAAVPGGRGRTTHLSMPHFLPADLASRLELLLPKRLRRS
ncbi:MAG: AAA family ATPase [Candidatus Poseidoniales archaeon]|nr:MAG: AAA family ATPase [Candidatus Poseidoniales archaeon]